MLLVDESQVRAHDVDAILARPTRGVGARAERDEEAKELDIRYAKEDLQAIYQHLAKAPDLLKREGAYEVRI